MNEGNNEWMKTWNDMQLMNGRNELMNACMTEWMIAMNAWMNEWMNWNEV